MNDAPIDFTANAASKVSALIHDEGNPNLKLRIYVAGGGCAGFEYKFALDDAVNDDDTIIEKNSVLVLVDTMSLQYLQGASIDFQEGLEGARFVITNPNATSTCGCGSSFST